MKPPFSRHTMHSQEACPTSLLIIMLMACPFYLPAEPSLPSCLTDHLSRYLFIQATREEQEKVPPCCVGQDCSLGTEVTLKSFFFYFLSGSLHFDSGQCGRRKVLKTGQQDT